MNREETELLQRRVPLLPFRRGHPSQVAPGEGDALGTCTVTSGRPHGTRAGLFLTRRPHGLGEYRRLEALSTHVLDEIGRLHQDVEGAPVPPARMEQQHKEHQRAGIPRGAHRRLDCAGLRPTPGGSTEVALAADAPPMQDPPWALALHGHASHDEVRKEHREEANHHDSEPPRRHNGSSSRESAASRTKRGGANTTARPVERRPWPPSEPLRAGGAQSTCGNLAWQRHARAPRAGARRNDAGPSAARTQSSRCPLQTGELCGAAAAAAATATPAQPPRRRGAPVRDHSLT